MRKQFAHAEVFGAETESDAAATTTEAAVEAAPEGEEPEAEAVAGEATAEEREAEAVSAAEADEDLASGDDDADEAVQELFDRGVLVDPYTGEPIRSKGDFNAWKERYDEEVAANDRAADAESGYAAEAAAIEDVVERELNAIRRHDPAVTALADIAADPRFDDIYAKVMRGYSLADAYVLVHGEELRRRELEQAERSFQNRLRGKEHLTATTAKGQGDVNVPRDVMAEFRRLLPDAGDEAIRRYYRRDRAKMKR